MAKGQKSRLIMAVIASDNTFERVNDHADTVWVGKCIHCNRKLTVSASGESLSHATLEHIVPRSHGGTDDLTNLALACARCNHQKGYRVDALSVGNPKAAEIFAKLQEKRRLRWREPMDDREG